MRFIPLLGIVVGAAAEWFGMGRSAVRDRINTQGGRL